MYICITRREGGGMDTKGDYHCGTGKLFYYVLTNYDYCSNLKYGNISKRIISFKIKIYFIYIYIKYTYEIIVLYI